MLVLFPLYIVLVPLTFFTPVVCRILVFKRFNESEGIPLERFRRNPVKPNELKTNIWDNGILPYKLSPNLPASTKEQLLKQVFPHYEERTCIRFKETTQTEGLYVTFNWRTEGPCQSGLGKSFRPYNIYLNSECGVEGAIHEVMHALGFWHEHTRPDSYKYIDVLNHNIIDDREIIYQSHDEPEVMSFGSYYDLQSVTHYGSYGGNSESFLGLFPLPTHKYLFPFSPLDTILSKIQYPRLSYQDAYQVNRLYDCCNIPWNYNTSAKYVPYERPERSTYEKPRADEGDCKPRSSKSNLTSTGGRFKRRGDFYDVPKKSKEKTAKLSYLLAHSICSAYSKFLTSHAIQGRIHSRLNPYEHVRVDNSQVIWRKCSSKGRNTSPSDCSSFRMFRPRERTDPGEFGNHFQGDLFEYNPDAGITNSQLWNKTIPIMFADHMNKTERRMVSRVMKEIELKTCLKFLSVLPTYTSHHVYISVDEPGCFAHVAFNSSRIRSRINLNRFGCLPHPGVIAHEFLHMLGLHHEQQKPFSRYWVFVHEECMEIDRRNEFVERKKEHPITRPFPVDVNSIMMLPADVFASSPDCKTLIVVEADPTRDTLGQRENITEMDIAKVVQLYKCCLSYDPPDS